MLPVWTNVQDTRPKVGATVLCGCSEDFTQMATFMGTDYYPEEPGAHIFLNQYDEFISVYCWIAVPPLPKKE